MYAVNNNAAAANNPVPVEENKEEVKADDQEPDVPINELGHIIAIDFHKGALIILGSKSLAGWRVHQDFKPGRITNDNKVTKLDFSVKYTEEIDIHYLRIAKPPGKVLLIGNRRPVQHHWREPNRSQA